jgi:hypothetical protein
MSAAKTITNQAADQSPAAALWRIAVNNYETALAASDAISAQYHAVCKAEDEGKADLSAVFDMERECEPFHDALFSAREALFRTPAPDAAAFAHKLNLLEAYLTEVQSEDAERFTAVANDARRLLGVE